MPRGIGSRSVRIASLEWAAFYLPRTFAQSQQLVGGRAVEVLDQSGGPSDFNVRRSCRTQAKVQARII